MGQNGILIYIFLVDKQWKRSKCMSVEKSEEPIEDLFITFGSDTDYHAKIFEEINKKIETFLKKESDNKDAIDGFLDILSTISYSLQEEFEELVSGDSEKSGLLEHYRKYSCCFWTQRSIQPKRSEE